MNVSDPTQISHLLGDIRRISDAVFKLQEELKTFDIMQSVNDAAGALAANGAAFPAGFSLTPSQVNDARFALASMRGAMDTAVAARADALNIVRLHLGRR